MYLNVARTELQRITGDVYKRQSIASEPNFMYCLGDPSPMRLPTPAAHTSPTTFVASLIRFSFLSRGLRRRGRP